MSAAVNVVPGEKPPFDAMVEARDSDHFLFFDSLHWQLDLPVVAGIQITKFHILLTIAAALTSFALIWLGKRMRSGEPPRGVAQNFLESIVYFVRDDIARPAIGDHDGDKYVPFLGTTFLFILIANLLGMIPFMGSPTASIAVTAALSLVGFVLTHWAGIKENGVFGYFKSYIPHIEIEGPAKVMLIFLVPLIAVLEMMTPFIRLGVLAVRLFANMLAGHVALFVLLFFIDMVSKPEWLNYNHVDEWWYYVVAPLSVILVTLLSLLELLVAGLQAFIFTLLTAIFIGLAKHPAH